MSNFFKYVDYADNIFKNCQLRNIQYSNLKDAALIDYFIKFYNNKENNLVVDFNEITVLRNLIK